MTEPANESKAVPAGEYAIEPDCSRAEFLAVAKVYARAVVDHFDLNVSVSELDTQVHCERFAEPNWWVTCTDCENRMGRYRRSKLVTNPENYHCGNCGGRLQVEANES